MSSHRVSNDCTLSFLKSTKKISFSLSKSIFWQQTGCTMSQKSQGQQGSLKKKNRKMQIVAMCDWAVPPRRLSARRAARRSRKQDKNKSFNTLRKTETQLHRHRRFTFLFCILNNLILCGANDSCSLQVCWSLHHARVLGFHSREPTVS